CTREPRASRSQAARDVRKARDPDRGAEAPGGRGRGCGVRLGVGRDHVSGDAGQAGDHLLRDLGGDPRAPGARSAVPRVGRPVQPPSTRQCARRRIIAGAGSYVSYLEGCSAPVRDENQLHAAVVELVALDAATIKYSTSQNWYPGDEAGRGGIYNFVTKRGACRGQDSKISWTQVETGSAITLNYPGVHTRAH